MMDLLTLGVRVVQCKACERVPVVRCKDCVYKKDATVNKKGYLICPASGMEITDQDYCSYGERRDDHE